jgi:hypothetical protein
VLVAQAQLLEEVLVVVQHLAQLHPLVVVVVDHGLQVHPQMVQMVGLEGVQLMAAV